jgi:small subunit ribosomal protein S15
MEVVIKCRKYGTVAMYFPLCYDTVMLTKRKKANAIKDVQRHDNDTGSPEAQVAVLTRRIEELSSHLKKNNKDKHSRRGLLGLVADRRRHLKYLEKVNKRSYNALVKKLGLKK